MLEMLPEDAVNDCMFLSWGMLARWIAKQERRMSTSWAAVILRRIIVMRFSDREVAVFPVVKRWYQLLLF